MNPESLAPPTPIENGIWSKAVPLLVLIGLLVLAWWFVWSLIRIIKGMIAVNEYRPIDNPRSWLFG